MEILRLADECEDSPAGLAEVMQCDPALVGRVLSAANSPLFSGSQPVATIEAAALRLGSVQLKKIALGFSLITANPTTSHPALDYSLFWSRSLAGAVTSRYLAALLGAAPPEEAFTCALLSGLGRLALCTVHPEAYWEMISTRRGASPSDLLSLEPG